MQLKTAQAQNQRPKQPKRKKTKREPKIESNTPKKLVHSEVFVSQKQPISDLETEEKRNVAVLELAKAEQESIGVFNFSNDHSLKNESKPANKTDRRSRRQKKPTTGLDQSLLEQTKQSTYDEQGVSVETVKSLTNFKHQTLKPKSPARSFSFETIRPLAGTKNLFCVKPRIQEMTSEFLVHDDKNELRVISQESESDKLVATVSLSANGLAAPTG